MPVIRFITFFTLAVVITLGAQAQSKPKYYGRGRVPKRKAQAICPIFEEGKYPYHSLGAKMGDPFAAVYKFYASPHFAIAIDAGKAASGLYSNYHQQRFGAFINLDTLNSDQRIFYMGHKVRFEWVMDTKLTYHHSASSLTQGLTWYLGAGWQWRYLNIDYEFFAEISMNENQMELFNVDMLTMGPTCSFGLEYAYFDLPLAAFMELALYMDLNENPGWRRLQGGVGLRYVF